MLFRSKMQVMMQEEIEEDGDFIVNEKDKVVNLTEHALLVGLEYKERPGNPFAGSVKN